MYDKLLYVPKICHETPLGFIGIVLNLLLLLLFLLYVHLYLRQTSL